jgi:NADH:ubiquinone oxidoreductase subunit C
MTALESIPERLGIAEPWVEKNGVYWLRTGSLEVRELARQMNALNARFVTITAYQLPGDEGFRLEYHWDLDGQLLGFPFFVSGNSIDSIYDLCEAADWIEREVHEGFALNFVGREYEPLLLRQDDTPGVNLREEVV